MFFEEEQTIPIECPLNGEEYDVTFYVNWDHYDNQCKATIESYSVNDAENLKSLINISISETIKLEKEDIENTIEFCALDEYNNAMLNERMQTC